MDFGCARDTRSYVQQVPSDVWGWSMNGELHVMCPSCESRGRVPQSFEGKDIRCKKCGNHFIAYDPEANHEFSVDASLAPLSSEEETHARERYEARVLSKNRNEMHEEDHRGQHGQRR
jgi:hypothetical protein